MTIENDGGNTEPVDVSEVQDTDAPEVTNEGEQSSDGGEEPPKKPTFQERFNEVYAKQKQFERDAESARQELEYWRTRAMQPAQPPAAPQAEEQPPQAPDPTQYQDGAYDPGFLNAHAAYTAELSAYQTRKVIAENNAQTRQQVEAQTVQQTFQQKASDAGEEGLAALQLQRDAQQGVVPLPQDVGVVLTQADNGVEIAAYLNQNRGEIYAMNSMPPPMRAMKLFEIGQQLREQATKTPDAPKPFPTADGPTGNQGTKTGGWKTQAEYRAFRQKFKKG